MVRVNFRVYDAHQCDQRGPEVRALLCYLFLSTIYFLSLPLSLLALSAVLDGKTMMVKVRGEKRALEDREAKELLMRRDCNINTGRSCEVDDWLMVLISRSEAQLKRHSPLDIMSCNP